MGMFKLVAMEQLKVLLCVVLLGNAYPAVPAPANSANACGEDLYVRVVLAHHFHFHLLFAFSAAILLVTVWSQVRIAGALAARAAAFAGAKAFDTDHAGRLWLRGPLLVAVLLSFAASVLAVVSFADGFLYLTGCDDDQPGYGYGSGSPLGVLMMGFFALPGPQCPRTRGRP